MSKRKWTITGAVALVASVITIIWFFTGKTFGEMFQREPKTAVDASVSEVAVGDILLFGQYDWRVLDVQDGKALLLSEAIIEQRPYNDEWIDVTWEDCSLRKYLNGEFLEEFHAKERERSARAHNYNPEDAGGKTKGKPFGTPGGKPTEDSVFLLGVADILKYFPGLKLLTDSDGDEWWYEADERLAAKSNNSESSWWLRSPGYYRTYAAYVLRDGSVRLVGNTVGNETGGVRPALWLKIN